MNRQILLDYASLKIQAKDIEAKLEFLQPEVLKQIQAARGDTDQPIALSELPGYVFSTMKRKSWTYSSFVKDSETALKERKKEEEANGTATFIENESPTFKETK